MADRLKIAIYGAGAIGGYLGAQLTIAGCDVTLVARGPHLHAIRRDGLTLEIDGGKKIVPVAATDYPQSVGPQDYVILAVKAHAVAPALEQIRTLLGRDTPVVTAQNGILWWYTYKVGGELEGRHLTSADPDGKIWQALGPQRAIGCVVYPSCEIVRPGVVRHIEGNRFMLGEPDGSRSARVTELAEVMNGAGFKAPVRERIRDDIWFKLLGNATFNPVSVLTGATLGEMGSDADGRTVVRQMMIEAMAVAEKLGVKFPMSIDRRIDGATAVGAHKTSMLQDYESGRPLELDALVTAVSELGALVGVPTPTIDVVLRLVLVKLAARPARTADSAQSPTQSSTRA